MKPIALCLFCLLLFPARSVAGEGQPPPCERLDEKVSGEGRKYSVYAEVNGPAAFASIACAVQWRNTELCAMELTDFDVTARVVDHDTGEELEMSKALYVVAENPDGGVTVAAFRKKESAEKYADGIKGGRILDYGGLTEYEF
jgi:hypothetical protein